MLAVLWADLGQKRSARVCAQLYLLGGRIARSIEPNVSPVRYTPSGRRLNSPGHEDEEVIVLRIDLKRWIHSPSVNNNPSVVMIASLSIGIVEERPDRNNWAACVRHR